MQTDKVVVQLLAVVQELQATCACIRQNTAAAKLNTLLLKRHTGRMEQLLVEHGIETLPAVIEENGLLVEQNVILIEQAEANAKSLLRLEAALARFQPDSETEDRHGHASVANLATTAD